VRKNGLIAAVVFIILYWACFSAWKLLGPRDTDLDIVKITMNVCVRTAITVTVVWFFLRWSGEAIKDFGLRPDLSWRGFARLAAFSIGLFIVTNIVLSTVIGAFIPRGDPDLPVASLFRDRSQLPYWVFSAIVGGGFTEELMRAFVLTRFEKLLGRGGLVAALLVDSAVFGLGHLYQGTASAIGSACTGLLLGLIFLSRRRVVDAMIVHAVFDLMGIAAAYALYGGKP
jgi:membrane protease YdiL (CAAX protease family)